MYSNIPQLAQLTALLETYGVCHIVVCPGSRNAPLVHNFYTRAQEAPHTFVLHPATDERSAGFVALGLALAQNAPTAVCVTSGTALLNLFPAVAEAYYRGVPLVAISADRQAAWIDQQDGQTIRQNEALRPYAKTFCLTEAKDETERWHNVCLMERALLPLTLGKGQPVHINVPIGEPLFNFSLPALPAQRKLCAVVAQQTNEEALSANDTLLSLLLEAKRPAVMMGEHNAPIAALEQADAEDRLLVMTELISNQRLPARLAAFDALAQGERPTTPDLVFSFGGGHFVHKHFKLALRSAPHCRVVMVSPTPLENMPEPLADISMHLTAFVQTDLEAFAAFLLKHLPPANAYVSTAKRRLDDVMALKAVLGRYDAGDALQPTGVKQKGALSVLQSEMQHRFSETEASKRPVVHLANSSIVRNASLTLHPSVAHFECNRGTNGIDGSVATAVGYALATPEQLNILITGDLSFVYDSNGLFLGNALPANLRIVLLNNGGGSIFHRLPGLDKSPALSPFIMGAHTAQPLKLAEAFGVECRSGLDFDFLLDADAATTRLLEITTTD